MVRAYRKASELRDKRTNYELWLQGMYVYEALCDASPLYRFTMEKKILKPEPYAKEPYPITPADQRERAERRAREMEEKLKAEFALFAKSVRSKMPQEAHPQEGGDS